MRQLTKKQKNLLDKWYSENKEDIQTGICFFNWSDCEQFPFELFEKLEKINDTEILAQEINRYISDKANKQDVNS